jgi:3-hydroxyacyl-[acyl-carrier-protein] dehydratase
MRFFLVDRVLEIRPGEFARGVKNVALGEDFLHDHFPDNPLLPGTLLVEALAQLGGFLVECTINAGDAEVRRAVLAQIERAKFYEPIGPGDQVELRCDLVSALEGAARVSAEARVGGARAAVATLTFVARRVDSEKVHQQRRDVYAIWTRGLTLDFPIR